jgi:hypothetical protein
MNKIAATVAFLAFLLCAAWVNAEEAHHTTINRSNQIIFNGEIIAEEISKATGCAISPILGISVLGAYTYYTTPAEERDQVPWHAKPAFWVPLLVVLLGIILKDSSKIALPKIIIMPLDAIETLLEKNVSAVLGLLVILSSITGKGIEQLQLAGYDLSFPLLTTAYAAESVNSATTATTAGLFEVGFLSILVTVVFGLVWVVSQSFNFLIFLCPFSWLDLLLTTFKNFIIALLLGAYLVNPFLGLFVSSIIILISLFLFARSYRFVIFGTIFSSDILFKRSRKHEIESSPIKAFAGSELPDVPSLSYGILTAQDPILVFHYRPWLFLPSKTITTSYRSDNCDVGIGALSPVIITTGKNFNTDLTLFRLRPLYRSHENRVAELLGLKGVRDVAFGKTIRDGYKWLLEQLGFTSKTKQRIT